MSAEIYKWELPKEPLGAVGLDQHFGPGETGTMRTELNFPVRPRGLVIPREVAANFTVVNLQVGRVMMVLGANGVPATAFSDETCTRCQKEKLALLLDTAWPILPAQCPFLLTLTNRSSTGQRFEGTLLVQDLDFEKESAKKRDLR